MSTAVPPGSGPSGPAQGDTSSPSTPLSWEGDRMFVVLFVYSFLILTMASTPRFNIYIYDYCYKRGFRKTARELLAEADISPESTPPINARQGLLFEFVYSLLLASQI
jgi:collagen type III alpha